MVQGLVRLRTREDRAGAVLFALRVDLIKQRFSNGLTRN